MTDILREMVRTRLKAIVKEELPKILMEEFSTAMDEEAPVRTTPVQEPTRQRRSYSQRYPVGSVIRVNQASRGPTTSPDTKLATVWRAIDQHLGVNSINRTVLARDIETLLDLQPRSAAKYISLLLEDGCLILDKAT